MRFFKRFILILFAITALTIAGGGLTAYLYQDEIEQLILGELSSQLKAPIQTTDVSFSIIKKFPYASLEFNNITAHDAFATDTLLNAEKLFLKFNALDLYNRNYRIQQLELVKGAANIYYDLDGNPNYEIWHNQTDTSSKENRLQFGIDEVLLKNIDLSYKNQYSGIDIAAHTKESTLSISFSSGDLEMQLHGELFSQHLYADKLNQLANKNIDYWLTLDVSETGTALNGVCHLDDLKLNLNGQFKDGYSLDIHLEQADLSSLLSHVHKRYLKPIKGYKIDGISDIDLHLSNEFNTNLPPAIIANFSVRKGQLSGTENWKLNNASFSASYTNGNKRNSASSAIILKNIRCLLNETPLDGDVKINNFENPNLQSNFNTQLALSSLRDWSIKLPLKKTEGKLAIKGFYNGAIGFLNDPFEDFKSAQKHFDIELTDGLVQYDSSLTSFQNTRAKLTLDNNRLAIDSLHTTIGKGSLLQFNGALENIFSFSNEIPLTIVGGIIADDILVEELFTASPDTSSQAISIPKNIQTNLKLQVNDLSYDRFKMINFESRLSIKEGLVKLKSMTLNSMGGTISGDLTFNQLTDGRLRLISNTHLEKIPVRNLFYEFRDFGQETLKYKHLRGTLSADIYLRSEWDAYLNTLQDNLYSFIDVKMIDGELIEFPPMLLMSDYISVNELKRIKFSTLENQIEIKNRMIEIPFMEIHSSAIDIAGSGTHSFDNEINYEFKLLLNEILSGKFKRKNKQKASEFAYEEDDGIKGMTLFLKMEGNVEEPIVSYNTLRLRESLSDGFKQEKKELKEVLQNELNGYDQENNTNKTLEESPDYNNILEWEEDEHLF